MARAADPAPLAAAVFGGTVGFGDPLWTGWDSRLAESIELAARNLPRRPMAFIAVAMAIASGTCFVKIHATGNRTSLPITTLERLLRTLVDPGGGLFIGCVHARRQRSWSAQAEKTGACSISPV